MKHPVHHNYYARRDGTPYAAPLANRGPEALQELLVGRREATDRQLDSLLRSELIHLAAVAEELAGMARAKVEKVWPGHLGRTEAN
ncbi:hypothetical protein ABT369_39490 [Dactylosporangium sp. NPDC000244]|uniref:hypothetical protein n=1 Tax=Dactylosporangium sp. NPDC000244 TaxID=3154365 RepID=UPI00331EF45F